MTDFSTIGDYARQIVRRRENAETRGEMDALISEVSTGRVRDLPGKLGGDFTTLAALERDLVALDAYTTSVTELSGRARATQTVLGEIADRTAAFAAELAGAPRGSSDGTTRVLAASARAALDTVLQSLNTSVAGRNVFAGTDVGGPAVAQAETILADLRARIAPLSDAAAVEAEIRGWFAPGGAFDTIGYLGAATVPGEQRIGPDQSAGLDITAADPALRDVMSGLALAALAAEPPVSGSPEGEQALHSAGMTVLLSSNERLATLRGSVGALEARLDIAQTRNAAETTALRLARSELTDADIFESAADLEAVQGQLELLYEITARSSALTLVRALG